MSNSWGKDKKKRSYLLEGEQAIGRIQLNPNRGVLIVTLNGEDIAYRPTRDNSLDTLYTNVTSLARTDPDRAIAYLNKYAVPGQFESNQFKEYTVGVELPTTQVPQTPQAFDAIANPIMENPERYNNLEEWQDKVMSTHPGVEIITGNNGELIAYAHNRDPSIVGSYNTTTNMGMVEIPQQEPQINTDMNTVDVDNGEMNITDMGESVAIRYYGSPNFGKKLEKKYSNASSKAITESYNSVVLIVPTSFKSVVEDLAGGEDEAEAILQALSQGDDVTLSVEPFSNDTEVLTGYDTKGNKIINALMGKDGEFKKLDDQEDNRGI